MNATASNSSGPGSAAVYWKNPSSLAWEAPQKLTASDAAPGDSFGWSVAMSDDGQVLAVGAPLRTLYYVSDGGLALQEHKHCGAVYVFLWDAAASLWLEAQIIQPTDPAEGLNFGTSISLSSNGVRLAVGASGYGYAANMSTYYQSMPHGSKDGGKRGAVYVYSNATSIGRGSENGVWVERKVTLSEGHDDDRFGYQVKISRDGDTLVAGYSPVDGREPGGAAYVYRFNTSIDAWQETSRLAPAKKLGVPRALAVSANGSVVALTSSGSTSIFSLKNTSASPWQWSRSTLDQPAGTSTMGYASISLSDDGTVALVGAPGDDDGRGATYTFRANGTIFSNTSVCTTVVSTTNCSYYLLPTEETGWVQRNRVRAMDWGTITGDRLRAQPPYFGLSGVEGGRNGPGLSPGITHTAPKNSASPTAGKLP